MDPKLTNHPTPAGSDTGPSPVLVAGSAGTPTKTDDMVDRAAQGLHRTVDQVAEQAKPPLRRLQQGIDEGSQALQQRTEQASQLADEWTTRLRVTIRQHPLTAVATALLCGLLLGRVAR